MKKLTVFILAALIAITCVSVAFAANWVEIGRNNDVIQSVDVSSVRRTGNTFKMWEKCILRTLRIQAEYKKLLEFSKTPAFFVRYVEYKINEPAVRGISTTYYAKDNAIVDSLGEAYEWYVFPPDSIGEIEWHFGRIILKLE